MNYAKYQTKFINKKITAVLKDTKVYLEITLNDAKQYEEIALERATEFVESIHKELDEKSSMIFLQSEVDLNQTKNSIKNWTKHVCGI